MVSCLITDVWMPENGLLECEQTCVGFRPPAGRDELGQALCPTGFIAAEWLDGSLGCVVDMATPPTDDQCTCDQVGGSLSVFWWP